MPQNIQHCTKHEEVKVKPIGPTFFGQIDTAEQDQFVEATENDGFIQLELQRLNRLLATHPKAKPFTNK